MFYVVRGSKQFGPYTPQRLAELVNLGQLLKQDSVIDPESMTTLTKAVCVGDILKQNGIRTSVANSGNIIAQAKQLGSRIWFSKDIFSWTQIKQDKRLVMLGAIGLAPLLAMWVLPEVDTLIFYAVSLYFAAIWGVFYYYMFKTKQVSVKTTIKLFFLVQLLIFVVWGIGLNNLNIFYNLLNEEAGVTVSNSIGFVLGVGVTEEFVKAIPLFYIATRSKTPLIPQTMVFYGVMCGISFGVFEGVEYQMGSNRELDYGASFFMNIARLTCLPFFHSMCTGLAGYFISFAVLKPCYRRYLYFMAIAVPAVIHGLYDTFANTIFSIFFSAFVVLLLNYYMKNDKHVQSALNE